MAENYKPPIRFTGFSDAWEQHKFGAILTEMKRSIELEDNKTYKLVTVKRRNEGVVSRGLLKGKDILVKNYFEIKSGDYIISKRQVVHGANGIVPPELDKAIVSNEYLVSVGNENITAEYLTLISKLPDMYKKFLLSSYGVDIEKLFFDVEDWKQRSVIIPQLAEQKKITCFFKYLDNLITLHQRKYDNLVNVKKSMLEKMFPKDGEDVPEVRFKGFIGVWEKHKLGDCFDERQERSAEGELISVTINDGIRKFSALGRHDNSSENKSHYKKVEIGDIAYNSMRMWQGASGYSPYWGILSPAYTVVIPKENVDSLFFSYVFKKPQMIHTFQIRSQGITSDTWNLKYPAFSEIETTLPKIEEQKKIAAFFKQLDSLITLHQCELGKLQNLKKALLKKMFV